MSVVHPAIYGPAEAALRKSCSCIERVLMHTVEFEMKEKYPTIVAELKKKVSPGNLTGD